MDISHNSSILTICPYYRTPITKSSNYSIIYWILNSYNLSLLQDTHYQIAKSSNFQIIYRILQPSQSVPATGYPLPNCQITCKCAD